MAEEDGAMTNEHLEEALEDVPQDLEELKTEDNHESD